MIVPVGGRVLVRRAPMDEYAGSVFLPDVARHYHQRGEVVASDHPDLREGDVVLYSKYECPVVTDRATGIRSDGVHTRSALDEELLLIDPDRVLAKVEEDG